MALNYIILCLIFLAGLFLVLASVLNFHVLFGNPEDNEHTAEGNHEQNRPVRGFFNPLGGITRLLMNVILLRDKKRSAYFFLGIVIIILGFVAIFFTGFLDEPIAFK
jgi:hypothetical protein